MATKPALLIMAACLPVLIAFDVNAAQTGDSMTVNFTGRLTGRRACTINDDKTIVVDFGKVGLKKVGTSEAIKTIDYTLDCTGMNDTHSLEMTIKATPISGHNSTMASSVSGLWVTFMKEGQAQALNTPFTVTDWHNPPKLDIQLDKDPAVELEAAAFSATATLMAEYY